ncbi:MAG TPA: class I SAM-dependent methyltransferase [Patescibacteria group bacterium]|nr:class I SAM-dependent methyltransferase [Patescibacteria group bacterium]
MNLSPLEDELRCHHCASAGLRVATGYAQAQRVTSDCKPWPAGGVLAMCQACSLVQTVASRQWQAECEQIYAGYTIYHQSCGIEQTVFDNASGAGQARSEAITKALQAHFPLPPRGRWLDIGCGNGAMLQACSRALPGWDLCGSEVNDKYRETVESIPGVERLFTCPVANIPGSFDVISLVHVIEHIPAPQSFVRPLAAKLKPNGLLLLEVPDCLQNFFMLMVADHCSHFSASMLAHIVGGAGYEVLQAADAWVPKEITVVARRPAELRAAAVDPPPVHESERVFRGWETLQQILAQVEPLTRADQFGIFGTSIAATWLDAQTGSAAKFFVDEDPHRIGKQHLGRLILSPAEIPEGASIYLALPRVIAGRVAERLQAAKPTVHFFTP